MDLVEKEIERLQSQLGNRGAGMVFTKGQLAVDRTRMEEVLGQRRLEDKVTSILKRVEKELDFVDEKIGSKFRLLDIDNDGVVRIHCNDLLHVTTYILYLRNINVVVFDEKICHWNYE